MVRFLPFGVQMMAPSLTWYPSPDQPERSLPLNSSIFSAAEPRPAVRVVKMVAAMQVRDKFFSRVIVLYLREISWDLSSDQASIEQILWV